MSNYEAAMTLETLGGLIDTRSVEKFIEDGREFDWHVHDEQRPGVGLRSHSANG